MPPTATTELRDLGDTFSASDLSKAGRMDLRRGPLSPQAHAVVQRLLEDVVLPAWPTGKTPRPSSVESSKAALGALLANLIEMEAKGRVGAHSVTTRAFVGLPFGLDIFSRITGALATAGLLSVHLGRQRLHTFTNRATGIAAKPISQGGEVTRFRLTGEGVDCIRSAGIDLEDWKAHWGRNADAGTSKPLKPSMAPLVVLRAAKAKAYGPKSRGTDMPVDLSDPKVAAIVKGLKEYNDFLMAAGVGGISFRGVQRVFNDGDQPGFDWQWGGRFKAVPGSEGAETPKSHERLQVITIGGERVGEVDLKAAHLCLLYALSGQPLDPAASDPYAMSGLDRKLVKAWVSKALGIGKVDFPIWSKDAREHYHNVAPGRRLSKDVPVAIVREAVLERHPILRHAGEPGTRALDLQYHESEIVWAAMAHLRTAGIASLSVHDSLVVPLTATQEAVSAMKQAFADHIEGITGQASSVIPVVEIEGH